MLLLTGLTGAYHYLPVVQNRSTLPRLMTVSIATAFLLYVASAMVAVAIASDLGITAQRVRHGIAWRCERSEPGTGMQHAVTVNAPPDAVWQWLVQLGQDRAGFYSYDWLERAFGLEIRNVTEIRSEWQTRQAGDFVPATQPGYLGMFDEPLGWRVTEAQPGRALVLDSWGAFVLEPLSDGQTRFIIRSTMSNARVPAWAAALNMMAFQLPHFIMERKMMLQIKTLAEEGRTS